MGNWPRSEWRLPGGVQPGSCLSRWTSVTLGAQEEIDPHWRAMRWLQVAMQGITDEEVPWHELVAPLTSGAEGVALSLAKHLVAAWWWNIKVRGEGECPPALSILNIGQFIMDEEAVGAWESHTGLWPTPVCCSG